MMVDSVGRSVGGDPDGTGEPEVLSALLELDPHALFLLDAERAVRHVNRRGRRLLGGGELFRKDADRLTGRTNRVDFQLSHAVRRLLRDGTDTNGRLFQAHGKEQFTLELSRLDVAHGPLVLVRIYQGFSGPDTCQGLELERVDRPVNPIHRRLSADRVHGPAHGDPRPPLPALEPLQSLEAYGRMGSMESAAKELGVDPRTVGRRIRDLEGSTNRSLLQGAGNQVRLTADGRRLARMATHAFDTLEAALRPRPPGKRRGRPPKAPARSDLDEGADGDRQRAKSPDGG